MGQNIEEFIMRLGWDDSKARQGMTRFRQDSEKLRAAEATRFDRMSGEMRKAQTAQEKLTRATQEYFTLQKKLADMMGTNNLRDLRRAGQLPTSYQSARNARAQALRELRAMRDFSDNGGGHGANSGVITESLVLLRELSRGNFNRAAGSVSILIQRLGILGKVATAVVHPVSLATGALAMIASGVISRGRAAGAILQNSSAAGFSVEGYQGLMRQAGREEGGPEAAQSAIGHLMGQAGAAASGSEGAYRSFRRWGVAITDVNGRLLAGEQIYKNVLDTLNKMPEGLSRTTAATELLGNEWRKLEREISEGSAGFDASKGGLSKQSLLTRKLMGQGIGDVPHGVWNWIKRANAWSDNLVLGHEGRTGSAANIARLTLQGQGLDEQLSILNARRNLSSPSRLASALKKVNPELYLERKSTLEAQTDVQNALADRGKSSLDSLAESGRRFTGMPHRRLYGMTARMRTALNIQDLDERANLAWQQGKDGQFTKLRSEADKMRAANPWLAANDRNPTLKMENSLSSIDARVKFIEDQVRAVVANSKS